MPRGLVSRHPVLWFALGAAFSWALVLFFDSPSIPWTRPIRPAMDHYIWSVALYLGLAVFIFGMHGMDIQKGRPWPPVALSIPFGVGLLHAAPALLGMAFAPRLTTIQHETQLVAFTTSFAWVFAEPVVAAKLTLRMAAKP